jgi:mannose-1-phosphate guanylyltransferase
MVGELIHVIILAGGKGTRLWSLGRETCTKQMLNDEGRTLSILIRKIYY